ncbi:MAG: hypothetical protein R3E13_04185 [Alphaproteobacteria bacterium]
MREKHQLKSWLENISEYTRNFWDMDTTRMPPPIKRDFKAFNQGRFAIIGGFALLLSYIEIWSVILSAALIIWGYKRCKLLYPRLKNELKFYKKNKK